MKSIEEIKDEYAGELGFRTFEDMFLSYGYSEYDNTTTEVAKRYAQSQTQELVELLEHCKTAIQAYNHFSPTATGNEILQAIQERLTKYQKP